ncbi:MAG: hypothetical protein AAGA93_22835 [Actinomycetota bacterium]
MPRTRLLAVLLGLALVAAACGSSSTSSTAPTGASDGESALSGTFETLDGTSIDLGDLAGQDVVLWFWAPW